MVPTIVTCITDKPRREREHGRANDSVAHTHGGCLAFTAATLVPMWAHARRSRRPSACQ